MGCRFESYLWSQSGKPLRGNGQTLQGRRVSRSVPAVLSAAPCAARQSRQNSRQSERLSRESLSPSTILGGRVERLDLLDWQTVGVFPASDEPVVFYRLDAKLKAQGN